MKKILLCLFFAVTMIVQIRAQNAEATTVLTRDSVVYQATFHFQLGVSDWVHKSDYTKMDRLLRWAKSDATTPIEITGWADKSGTTERNCEISLRRTRMIANIAPPVDKATAFTTDYILAPTEAGKLAGLKF